MDILQVRLFGYVQVSHNNWKTEVNTTRMIKGLLAFLLLERHRTHSREELAALFWGEQDEEKARGCLNTALWRLRGALEPPGVPHQTYLSCNRFGEVGFNRTSRYWLDVAIFEEQTEKILAIPFDVIDEKKIHKLTNLLQLYRGELLEGFYDDWAIRERERLRALYLSSLAYLMRYELYHRAYEKGLAYGRRILELDPLREEIHRDLIRLHLQHNQRLLAIRQYKICCETLRAELDIQPMPETQALYAQAVSSEEMPVAKYFKESPHQLHEALQDLKQAAQSVENAHVRLTRAIGSLEAYIRNRSNLSSV